MFLGEYQHSVDDKGRLVMPSKFRDRLQDGLVVTKGQDRCVYIYPMDRWEEELGKLGALPRTSKRNRNFVRALLGAAVDQRMDAQGRIQLPQTLRQYAHLGKDVAVVGVGDRIEVWEPETWRALGEEADDLYSEIDEALGEDGI